MHVPSVYIYIGEFSFAQRVDNSRFHCLACKGFGDQVLISIWEAYPPLWLAILLIKDGYTLHISLFVDHQYMALVILNLEKKKERRKIDV